MEVEVKFKVDSFDQVLDKLSSMGAKFLGSHHEKDVYFTPFSEKEVLRLRYSDAGMVLTYKRIIPNDSTQSAIELESRVDGEIESILESIGHRRVVEKEKHREMYSLDKVTVNLDDVKGLGKFVELEYIGEQQDGERILRGVSEKLGFSWGARITKPYIRQLLELKD